MTGRELLFEELEKRGLTKTQIESKGVAAVLDVIANDGKNNYMKAKELEDAIRIKESALRALNEDLLIRRSQKEFELKELDRKLEVRKQQCDEYVDDAKDYITKFNKSLEACETPEARDRLRLAQVFTNSVHIQSPQNMSVFIYTLGALLAGTSPSELSRFRPLSKDDLEHLPDWLPIEI